MNRRVMDFANRPDLFPHQIEFGSDRVLLVAMDEQDYDQASFLDQRLLAEKRAMQWANWSELADLPGQGRNDAQFIFHIGHVGSTLVSRLLGVCDTVLALREPLILRQLAELKGLENTPCSPWSPGLLDERIEVVVRWLSRSFRPAQRSLVKATSFASELSQDILSNQQRRAIFLYLRPHRYAQTILAGENSRMELATLSTVRLHRLHRHLGAEPFRLWRLDEAQRAIMSWAVEMIALERAAGANVLWIDFDQFLRQPAEGLLQMAQFLEINLDLPRARNLVGSELMKQYSKAPEHGYSSELREQLLTEADRTHGSSIARARAWIERAAQDYPALAGVLGRASGED